MKPSSFLRFSLGAVLLCAPVMVNAANSESSSAKDSIFAETKPDASSSKSEEEEKFSIVPHGFAGIQSFRVHRYKNNGDEFKSQIFNNSVLNYTFDILSGNHLSIHAGIEGYVSFSTLPYDKLGTVGSGRNEQALPLWSWYMAEAEMAYTFGDPQGTFHGDVGIGVFPYKYNEEARNLGEYLFRSGTYPGWLLGTFDWTATRLTGARLGTTLFGNWKNDLMLTTEMEWFPFYDLSLSWVSALPVGKILNIGGGVVLSRFLPANDDLTTPKITQNTGDKILTNYYLKNGDTTFYTFTGVKAMGHATLDPKGFFNWNPSHRIFTLGKEDGKLFAEVAVLGVKNQGPIYDDVLQRMPVMFGFNFPTFNLLDVLTFQWEYYASPYPNDYANQIRFVSAGVPQPTKGSMGTGGNSKYLVSDTANFFTKDNWKWSVYARYWMGKHLAIVGQVARDHWRTSTPYANRRDTEEALSDQKHWYAALKIVSVW